MVKSTTKKCNKIYFKINIDDDKKYILLKEGHRFIDNIIQSVNKYDIENNTYVSLNITKILDYDDFIILCQKIVDFINDDSKNIYYNYNNRERYYKFSLQDDKSKISYRFIDDDDDC